MRASRFSDAQIVNALAEVAAGTSAVALCRRLGITETTFYRWRKQRSSAVGMRPAEVRALQDENQRLREIVANFLLDKVPIAKKK
jgi:putative transposase